MLDFGTMPFPVLEGQSIGIIPPGTDANGKPHVARQYSIASARNGERPGYNNLALTVKRVTQDHEGKPVRGVASNYVCDLKVGDKIATLVSLSLTPLVIEEIHAMRPAIDQVDITGQAILFQSGIYAKLPDDMPEGLALSALDVAGAPAQTGKLVQQGQKVLVIGGGGKSGLLCLYEAKKRAGVTGLVVCAAGSQKSEDRARNLNLADEYFHMDASDAVGMYEKAMELTNGELYDVVINCVSIENTEMGSILSCKDDGTVYFFSMATSFTKAALGAEGVGKDVNMIVGNGYTKGHAAVTLQELREHEGLRKLFEEMYA